MCFKLPKTLFLLELKININVFKLVQLASHITIKMKKLVMINIILVQANSNVVMNFFSAKKYYCEDDCYNGDGIKRKNKLYVKDNHCIEEKDYPSGYKKQRENYGR